MDIEEIVYTARDNKIQMALSVDGAPIVHTSILRCQVQVGSTLIDSATHPTFFDFTNPAMLIIKLGDAGLSPGCYIANLYIFDITSIEGLFWGSFTLTVV